VRAPSSTSAAILASGVRKAFGEHLVLDDVDLTVEEGTVFALLGPNGAGKTTMVNILATLLRPDAGELRVAGHDPVRDPDGVRHAIGVTGQFSAVDDLLTGQENLRLMADLRHLGFARGRQRVTDLLERFDLSEASGRTVTTYSGGMKRRLDLAMTLVGNPRVIFLDEPTTGLDPRSRRDMWDQVRELVADGVTILLTTQYLDEADHLAERIGVLDRGRIVGIGTPSELKRAMRGEHVRLHFSDQASLERAAQVLEEGSALPEDLSLQVPSDSSGRSLHTLLCRLQAAGIDAERVSVHERDLDDVFFALTGHASEEMADG
jgi:ABC-2 type transport system ATP-binding protein